jgi:hypothetical protein
MNRDSTASALTFNEVDTERGVQSHFDAGSQTGKIIVSQEVLAEWDRLSPDEKAAFDKKLVRKLDFRLVPWLSLLYLLSFLDRTNIGNAKLQGVSKHGVSLTF